MSVEIYVFAIDIFCFFICGLGLSDRLPFFTLFGFLISFIVVGFQISALYLSNLPLFVFSILIVLFNGILLLHKSTKTGL